MSLRSFKNHRSWKLGRNHGFCQPAIPSWFLVSIWETLTVFHSFMGVEPSVVCMLLFVFACLYLEQFWLLLRVLFITLWLQMGCDKPLLEVLWIMSSILFQYGKYCSCRHFRQPITKASDFCGASSSSRRLLHHFFNTDSDFLTNPVQDWCACRYKNPVQDWCACRSADWCAVAL